MSKSREETKVETRKKLIKAARKSFAKYGFAKTSMDDLTSKVGLTRGALYHHFGSKEGLLMAVIDEIDSEMVIKAKLASSKAKTKWQGLLDESVAYIEMALDPEIQKIVLLDGPSVLGDPSKWPSQNACLMRTTQIINELIQEKTLKEVDAIAAAHLLNGAAMNAALCIVSADDPKKKLKSIVHAFLLFANGLML